MESIFKDRRPPRQDKGEPSSCLALVDGVLHRSPDGCARVRPAWVARMCDAAKSDKLQAFLIYGRLRRGRAPKDVKRRAGGKRKYKADLQHRRRWGDRKGRLRQRWPASLYELAMFSWSRRRPYLVDVGGRQVRRDECPCAKGQPLHMRPGPGWLFRGSRAGSHWTVDWRGPDSASPKRAGACLGSRFQGPSLVPARWIAVGRARWR
jgi:hypothetical protein